MMHGKARTRRRLHGHSIGALGHHSRATRTESCLTPRSRSPNARAVFPHAPVGLIYVTQRFEVDKSIKVNKVRFKESICRSIDESWRAGDLLISVEVEGEHNDVQIVRVAVKVRTARRQPETPSTEATAEDIEKLFAGFAATPASAGVAPDVDIRKVHPPQIELGHFGGAALQAAFDAVRITFVGPKGQQSKLERAALRIPDLRLRPEVLYNFLALRAALHGDEKPPERNRIEALLETHDARMELLKRAQYVESDELERAVAPSDVASVRACAQPEAHLEDDDCDDGAADGAVEAGGGGGPAPQMEHVGVVDYAEQSMAAVIAGIDKAIPRNTAWKLRLAPCTEAQRTQLRTLCRTTDLVTFYGLRYDEAADCLDAHIVLREARRIDWLTGRVVGSQRANWTPVVVSAAERRQLAMQYSEAVDRGDNVESDARRHPGSTRGSDDDACDTDDSLQLSHSSGARGAGRDAGNATAPPLEFERGAHPLDDYGCAAKALYDAWWPTFLLRRGLQQDVPLKQDKIRHLFLYFDNRAAHDMPLLFHLASVLLRHAVNSAVGVRVKRDAKKFAAFVELVNRTDFLDLLETASRNAKTREAREVVAKLVNLVNLTGKAVPWGSQERAAEVRRPGGVTGTAQAAPSSREQLSAFSTAWPACVRRWSSTWRCIASKAPAASSRPWPRTTSTTCCAFCSRTRTSARRTFPRSRPRQASPTTSRTSCNASSTTSRTSCNGAKPWPSRAPLACSTWRRTRVSCERSPESCCPGCPLTRR